MGGGGGENTTLWITRVCGKGKERKKAQLSTGSGDKRVGGRRATTTPGLLWSVANAEWLGEEGTYLSSIYHDPCHHCNVFSRGLRELLARLAYNPLERGRGVTRGRVRQSGNGGTGGQGVSGALPSRCLPACLQPRSSGLPLPCCSQLILKAEERVLANFAFAAGGSCVKAATLHPLSSEEAALDTAGVASG